MVRQKVDPLMWRASLLGWILGTTVVLSGCIFEERDECPEDDYLDKGRSTSDRGQAGPVETESHRPLEPATHEDELYPDECDH